MKIIILLGPPGAGKGTQAGLLAEKLHLFYFETSKILEETFANAKENDVLEIERKEYRIGDEKKLWETGILCSPPFVTFLVQEKLKELALAKKSLVIAGSPRTLQEGERIIPLLAELYQKENIRVIVLELSAEQSLFRNSNRRICELLRHPIVFGEETKSLSRCPLDGSGLMKRGALDDPEVIRVRLKEYEERTFPLIEYCKKYGLSVSEVNGDQPVANVFAEIIRILQA